MGSSGSGAILIARKVARAAALIASQTQAAPSHASRQSCLLLLDCSRGVAKSRSLCRCRQATITPLQLSIRGIYGQTGGRSWHSPQRHVEPSLRQQAGVRAGVPLLAKLAAHG